MPLDQATIDAVNQSFGGGSPGGTIPQSRGVPALPAETRDAAGNIVTPESAPRMAPADTAPAAVAFKPRVRDGVNTTNMDPRLTERVNRLYDLMPESVRESAEITSARRSEAQQAVAYQKFISGIGGLAAKPGRSQHEQRGAELPAAVDLADGPALKWLESKDGRQALASVGLAQPFVSKGDPGHIQLSEAGARSDSVASAKASDQRQFDPDKIKAVNDALLSKGPTTASTSMLESLGQGLIAESAEAPKFVEHSEALLSGIGYGIAELPMGAKQATVGESVASGLDEKMRQLQSSFDNSEGERAAFLSGRIVGATGTILLSSGLLGSAKLASVMPRIVTAITEGAGSVGRAIGVGAAAGATQFYEKPDEEQRPFNINARAFDATVGGLLGAGAGVVVRGVKYAADQLARTSLGQSFLPVLAQTAKNVATDSTQPLGDALTRYEQATRIKNTRYSLRDATGREFEGFESGVGSGQDGFAQAIEPFLPRAKPRGGVTVATRREVESTAARVREILGLDGEEARLAAAEKAQERYEAETNRIIPQGLGPQARAQVQAQLAPPPEPFTPRPVPTDLYSQARTEINARITASKNTAARVQLGQMLRAVDKVAKDAAGEGGSPEAFLRKATAATEFYKNNVAPLKEFFGNKTHSELLREMAGGSLSQMTPAKFNAKVFHIIESGDVRQVELLGKMLGPKGRENMTSLAMARALEGVQDGEVRPALKYIQKNERALRTLLGREEYIQLVGVGKIADELSEYVTSKRADKWKGVFDWGHSLGPALVFYKIAEGHFAMATRIALALPAYHLAMNIAHNIHSVPLIKPMVKAAAGMKPGSPELDSMISRIERRMRALTAVGARMEQ
jgi:hypothetical protein